MSLLNLGKTGNCGYRQNRQWLKSSWFCIEQKTIKKVLFKESTGSLSLVIHCYFIVKNNRNSRHIGQDTPNSRFSMINNHKNHHRENVLFPVIGQLTESHRGRFKTSNSLFCHHLRKSVQGKATPVLALGLF